MIPFYFLDGPLKGKTFKCDFRSTEHEGKLYKKGTYELIKEGYHLYADVAFIKRPKHTPVIPFKNWYFKTKHMQGRLVEYPELYDAIKNHLHRASFVE